MWRFKGSDGSGDSFAISVLRCKLNLADTYSFRIYTDLRASDICPNSANWCARTRRYAIKCGNPMNGSCPLVVGRNENAYSAISDRTIASEIAACPGQR